MDLIMMPNEILVLIFNQINWSDIYRLNRTCKKIQSVCQSNRWRNTVQIKYDLDLVKLNSSSIIFTNYCFTKSINQIQTQNFNIFQKIQTVDLSWCGTNDCVVEMFISCQNMNLEGNPGITGDGLTNLTMCTNLNLRKCINFQPKYLSNLTGLRRLNLSCENRGDNFKYLESLTKLQSVCLSSTDFSDSYVHLLKNCIKIDLSYCLKITIKSLPSFKNCQKISLAHTYAEDSWLEYLTHCSSIDLSYCKNVTDHGLKKLVNCTKLKLTNCDISGNFIRSLPQLKELTLVRCKNITNQITSFVRNLICLDLSYNNQLTDECFAKLTHIQYLNLSGCPQLSDRIACTLIGGQFLDLSYCQISNRTIKFLQTKITVKAIGIKNNINDFTGIFKNWREKIYDFFYNNNPKPYRKLPFDYSI